MRTNAPPTGPGTGGQVGFQPTFPGRRIAPMVMGSALGLALIGAAGAGWDYSRHGTPFFGQASVAFLVYAGLLVACLRGIRTTLESWVAVFTHGSALLIMSLALLRGDGLAAPGLPVLFALALYQGLHGRRGTTLSYTIVALMGLTGAGLGQALNPPVAADTHFLLHGLIVQAVTLMLLSAMGHHASSLMARAAESIELKRQLFANSAEGMGVLDARTEPMRLRIANAALREMDGPNGALVAGAHAALMQRPPPLDDTTGALDGKVEWQWESADGASGASARTLRTTLAPLSPQEPGLWSVNSRDVSAEFAREQQLRQAQLQAEAASAAKSRFLALMSHEIRTPLNGITGLVELAGQTGLPESTRQHYMALLQDSAHTLSDLVDDVLDMAKIEAGQMDLNPTRVHLPTIFQSLLALNLPMAHAKGLSLNLRLSDDVPEWVRVDGLRLRQVVANFLTNALKYTAQGRIDCSARLLNGDRLRVEVVDTGMGITPEQQSRLFKAYEQPHGLGAVAVGDRMIKGTGLGLAICAELARLMHGQVGVLSTPGRGSCFWFELPLERVEPPIEGVESLDGDRRPALSSPHRRSVAPATPTRTEEAGPLQPVDAPRLAGLRLLVVDDNRINLVVARRLLERAGAQVVTAEEATQALDLFAEYRHAGRAFDMVLLDIQMPGMDGLEAARRLRAMPGGDAVTILAASAAVTVEDAQDARAAGMDGFFPKPVDWQALVSRIGAINDQRMNAR